jgi:mono/diheme cytochrome c family protein
MHSRREINQFSILSSALVVFAFLLLLIASCGKKEETATTKVEGTTSTESPSTPSTTATPGDTSHAAAPAPDTAAKAGALSGKALAGQKIFYNTSFGKVKVACAGCHADGFPTTKDARIRTGATLAGVASRTSTWNGLVKGSDLKARAYGADICAAVYQERAEEVIAKALAPSDIEALNEYFAAINANPGAVTKNIPVQWVSKPAFSDEEEIDEKAAKPALKAIMKLAGDPAAGQAIFARTCQYCHGVKEKKVGPALAKPFEELEFAVKTIRVGSGAMPFYAKDRLSDQQIADVVAYIQQEMGK